MNSEPIATAEVLDAHNNHSGPPAAKQFRGYWWGLGLPCGPIGPYTVKADAVDDIRGLKRFYQSKGSELAQKAREWIASSDGKQAVERVVAEARQAKDRLREARRVDPESLNKPFTL